MRLLCLLFDHPYRLVRIESGDATITSRGRVVGPTKYHYTCACCGVNVVNPFEENIHEESRTANA